MIICYSIALATLVAGQTCKPGEGGECNSESSIPLAGPTEQQLADELTRLWDTVDALTDQCSQVCSDTSHPGPGPAEKHRNCAEIQASGQTKNGVYAIYPGSEEVNAYCDFTTDGGGWTVFQNRVNGSKDFNKRSRPYKRGFGNPFSEYWLGNEAISQLTAASPQQLRVELEDFQGNVAVANYAEFSLAPSSGQYAITVSGYSGNAGDSLSYHSGKAFHAVGSNDAQSCEWEPRAGWWTDQCLPNDGTYTSNLNAPYTTDWWDVGFAGGIYWASFNGFSASLKHTQMKMRPVVPPS